MGEKNAEGVLTKFNKVDFDTITEHEANGWILLTDPNYAYYEEVKPDTNG